LQLRRLEIEERRLQAEREDKRAQEQARQAELEDKRAQEQRQWEAQERAKDRKFELRRLELQRPQAPPVAARRDSVPRFKVENAVRLIPRFTDQDVETFLLSFEKIAFLNNFPREKYSAIIFRLTSPGKRGPAVGQRGTAAAV